MTYDAVAAELNITKRVLSTYIRLGYFQTYGEKGGARITTESLERWLWWQRATWPDGINPDGYIYLIYSYKLFKIGLSRNVAERIRNIRAMSSAPVQLLHQIPTNNMPKSELFLHNLFANRREHGEWFRLVPNDITAIRRCKALYF
jgi:hypothetical protein